MNDLAVLPVSETALLGQNNLIGSLWNHVAALDNSAGLTGVLSTIRSTVGKDTLTARSEKLSILGTNIGLIPRTSSDSKGHLNQALDAVGPISSDTSASDLDSLSLFSQLQYHGHNHHEHSAAGNHHETGIANVDFITGSAEGTALVGDSTTSLFTWNTVTPSPIGRGEAQGAAVNGKVYVFGGFFNSNYQATTRSDVYDPVMNKWTRIADMPQALTHSAVAVDGQAIYLVGGYVGDHPGPSTNHVWKYDITTNTWGEAPSLPTQRAAGAAVRLGRELHFFGGATRTAAQLNEVDQDDHYVLSLDGGTSWTSKAAMPNPRNHLAGVVLDGKIYAMGGQHERNEKSGNQSQVDVYNPATNTWKQVANLPAPRGHISSSAFVTDNRINVIGGTLNGNKPSVDVTTYDPQANVWVKLPSLPAGRKSPVADVIGDQIIVSTGNSGGPTTTTWTGIFANKWESSIAMPVALGEVAGGIIGNKLYLVGEGSSATLAYNLSTGTWSSTSALAPRPLVGHHHAAQVFNKKLYLFGGVDSGAGKVQIYNPATNTWDLGANMPFAAGSSSSTVINKQIYVAGGIIGSSTTDKVARYNPVTNTWKSLAAMKQGRNYAASATDGTKLYVFGGRDGGNVPSNGFNTVQIYNPTTNTWASSSDIGSTLAPLPQARGGMGRAVYFNHEFYVMGGETQDGAGATDQKVYDRVDIYNPLTNQWRLGTPMPTARHGIFPLLLAGRIHVAGGGVRAGHSSSSLFEIYNPSTVDPINKAPGISLTGTALAYTENAGAVVVENGATVSDPDSTNFDTGTLTLQFTANGTLDDRLGIRNQGVEAGQIGASGSNLTYGGATIGTFSGGTGGSTPLIITFNPSAGVSAVEALMNNVTYENTSDNPLTTSRTVSFALTDGDGGTSNSDTKAINITAVNDPPVLVTNSGLTLSQGAVAVINNSVLQVSDIDHSASELIYTLTGLPDYGTLMLDGIAIAAIGGTFSQADIDADKLTYTHDGSTATHDGFTFTAADIAGNAIAATIFDIALTLNESLTYVNLGRNKFSRS